MRLAFAALLAAASAVEDDPAFAGWRMVDRFGGFRYEVEADSLEQIATKADELGCFGWVRRPAACAARSALAQAQRTERGTAVGEARCAKAVAAKFREWFGPTAAIYEYPGASGRTK